MNPVLDRWNALPTPAAISELLPCCASHRWAAQLCRQRPFESPSELFTAADAIWKTLGTEDYLEAFRAHPRIGESRAAHASPESLAWSKQEQSRTALAAPSTLDLLAAGNRAYETRHGFTCIVCATGKSAEEMLAILNTRIHNHTAAEILEAAEQQRQITHLRLQKWLSAEW